MVDVVVVTGPCGAGKSSVGFEALDRLARAGVKAAFVDGVLAHVAPTSPVTFSPSSGQARDVRPVVEGSIKTAVPKPGPDGRAQKQELRRSAMLSGGNHNGVYRGLTVAAHRRAVSVNGRLDAPVALQGLSDECRKSLGIRGPLSIESPEHSNAIVLGSVLAKLELPLDSIDWHLEGDDGFD